MEIIFIDGGGSEWIDPLVQAISIKEPSDQDVKVFLRQRGLKNIGRK